MPRRFPGVDLPRILDVSGLEDPLRLPEVVRRNFQAVDQNLRELLRQEQASLDTESELQALIDELDALIVSLTTLIEALSDELDALELVVDGILPVDLADDDDVIGELPTIKAGVAPGGTTGQVYKKQSGTDFDADWEDEAGSSGGLLNVQVITSGSGTYTPTAGTEFIIIELVGGGGGGGGADSSAGLSAIAGSGGAGGYVRKRITANFDGAAYAVGTGGGGGAAANGAGTAGGDTTFTLPASTVYTAGGGGLGAGGSTGSAANIGPQGGAGGSATNGDINVPGGAAFRGTRISAITAAAGQAGSSLYGSASSPMPGIFADNSASAGADATGYGAGGQGSLCTGTGTATAGGDGSDGVIIIWEFATAIVAGDLGNYTVGTSFPGSPATGDRCFRTDLGREYWWNGSIWTPLSPVAVRLTSSSPGNAGNADATVPFDAAAFDDATDTGEEFWDSGDPDKITMPWDGLYSIEYSAGVTNNSTASRYFAHIRMDGTTTIGPRGYANRQATTNVQTQAGNSFKYRFTAGQYIEVRDNNLSGSLAREAALIGLSVTFLGS